MAVLGLCMVLGYLLSVFVIEPILLRRRTGRSAWLVSLGANRWERAANVMFLFGCGLDLANPVLALARVVVPLGLPGVVIVPTSVVFLGSVALAVRSQRVMGAAWRTGIDPDHPTQLVTNGPFRLVRNPTYTSLVACSVSVGLLVPSVLALAGLITCLAALQVQTRLVEEPHLRRMHGHAYRRYTTHVGRFVPWVGRIPES